MSSHIIINLINPQALFGKINSLVARNLDKLFPLMLHFRLQNNEMCPFVTCVYFASGSKCGLSTPLTSGELAGGKLVLFIVLHSSSLALEKDGLSLTGGQKRKREERRVR